MPVLENLAGQLARLRNLLPAGDVASSNTGGAEPRRLVLVSSGAVAAGRAALATRGHVVETTGLAARQAAAAVGQGQLMQSWDKVFFAHRMPTAQVLLTRDDLRARQRFLNARNTFAELLEWGVLPIVNENDTVSISELKFGDNDCLASLLVNLTGADLFINLTSASGVLSADPQKDPNAPIMPPSGAGLRPGLAAGLAAAVGLVSTAGSAFAAAFSGAAVFWGSVLGVVALPVVFLVAMSAPTCPWTSCHRCRLQWRPARWSGCPGRRGNC